MDEQVAVQPQKEIDMTNAVEYEGKDKKTYLRLDVMEVAIPAEFKGRFLRVDSATGKIFYSKAKPLTDEQKEENKAERAKIIAERQKVRDAENKVFKKYKAELKDAMSKANADMNADFKKAMKEKRVPSNALIELASKASAKYKIAVGSKTKADAENAIAEME